MPQLDELKKHLKKGGIYRREDPMKWSKSVDRHLEELTFKGTLQKVSQSLLFSEGIQIW
jgi:hypothetical protein